MAFKNNYSLDISEKEAAKLIRTQRRWFAARSAAGAQSGRAVASDSLSHRLKLFEQFLRRRKRKGKRAVSKTRKIDYFLIREDSREENYDFTVRHDEIHR